MSDIRDLRDALCSAVVALKGDVDDDDRASAMADGRRILAKTEDAETRKEQVRCPEFASLFASMYPMLRETALEQGYALALHGSMARDFDVIAIPWTDSASSGDDLAESLRAAVRGRIPGPALAQPHGRMAWVIHFSKPTYAYLDLSVMPRDRDRI